MSTWRLERRRVASQLARFLPGWVLLIRFKKLKNVQFTTKAVSNMKDQVKKKTYSVILKCIDDSTHFDRFLRFVQVAPQPLPFLADDRELLDLERFCTNPSKPGILSIDTTYNCGEFYVTPTTYRHQYRLSKRTGKYPLLLGPPLIHKHRDQEAFSYLASSMIRLKPSLARILAVGCDRGKTIKNGLIEFHSWFVRYQAKDMKECFSIQLGGMSA